MSVHALINILGQQETQLLDSEYGLRRMKLVLSTMLQGVEFIKGVPEIDNTLDQIEDAWPYVNGDVQKANAAVNAAYQQAEIARHAASKLQKKMRETDYETDTESIANFNSIMAQLETRVELARESLSTLIQDTNDFVQIFGVLREQVSKLDLPQSLQKSLMALFEDAEFFSDLVTTSYKLLKGERKQKAQSMDARERLAKAASSLLKKRQAE